MESPDFVATISPLAEGLAWRAVRRDGVVVSGPDARTWLQGQITQDLALLPGEGAVLTLVLSPQGKVESYCRVSLFGEDGFLLDLKAGFGPSLEERLRRFKLRVKAEVLRLEDLVAVELRGSSAPLEIGRGEIASLPTCWQGLPGRDVLFRGSLADVEATALEVLGESPGSGEAFEAERIAAGIPELGAELTERTIPQEAGELVARCVSFTMGCYTGQELVARLDARGSNVPRNLKSVLIWTRLGMIAPSPGLKLYIEGAVIGELTSVAMASSQPGSGARDTEAPYVALAYVKRGTESPCDVTISGVAPDVTYQGTVHPLGVLNSDREV